MAQSNDLKKGAAAAFIPEKSTLQTLKEAASRCRACLPWLAAEIELIRPQIIIALGATAAQSLFGKHVRVTRDRGRMLESDLASFAAATVHPSSILRASSKDDRTRAFDGLVEDLRLVAEALSKMKPYIAL